MPVHVYTQVYVHTHTHTALWDSQEWVKFSCFEDGHGETEAGGSRVQDQPGLHSEVLSQKTKLLLLMNFPPFKDKDERLRKNK
jgi:hypothetical protein